MDGLSSWIPAQVAALCMLLFSLDLAHLFQLESYQLPGYFRALRRLGQTALRPGMSLGAMMLLAYALAGGMGGGLWYLLGMGLLLAHAVRHALGWLRLPKKKPLVFTPRVKRLTAIALVGYALLCLLLALVLQPFWCAVLALGLPYVFALLAWAAQPLEKAINQGFYRDAQAILASHKDLIRIGITGSYGKTGTKFMLATLLSEKYRVLATPSSFNTPMGVTRVIREQLTGDFQVFIAEMGARHVGDIKELCQLVHPSYGLLTSVGPQHLETFGSIERVASTKYELIESLPPDGVAFFARDGGICEGLYAKTAIEKHLAGDRLKAGDIQVGSWGSRFTLTDREGGSILCQTKLLGRHAIDNLLLCCEVAVGLGLTLAQLAQGISRLQPVTARLELIQGAGGVTIINDGFNSNPAGAKAALAVLSQFPGQRFIITPGMVELGERQAALNRSFGEQMKGCVDVAILVGERHTAPITQGLAQSGFDMGKVHVVGSIEESRRLLATMVKPGDTVLYENDLPDNY